MAAAAPVPIRSSWRREIGATGALTSVSCAIVPGFVAAVSDVVVFGVVGILGFLGESFLSLSLNTETKSVIELGPHGRVFGTRVRCKKPLPKVSVCQSTAHPRVLKGSEALIHKFCNLRLHKLRNREGRVRCDF